MQRRRTDGHHSPTHPTRFLAIALLAVGAATAGCSASLGDDADGEAAERTTTDRNGSFLEQAREKGL